MFDYAAEERKTSLSSILSSWGPDDHDSFFNSPTMRRETERVERFRRFLHEQALAEDGLTWLQRWKLKIAYRYRAGAGEAFKLWEMSRSLEGFTKALHSWTSSRVPACGYENREVASLSNEEWSRAVQERFAGAEDIYFRLFSYDAKKLMGLSAEEGDEAAMMEFVAALAAVSIKGWPRFFADGPQQSPYITQRYDEVVARCVAAKKNRHEIEPRRLALYAMAGIEPTDSDILDDFPEEWVIPALENRD